MENDYRSEMEAMKIKNIVLSSLFVIISLLTGCDHSKNIEAKNSPKIYCQPFSVESGEIRKYTSDDGKAEQYPQFREYKTAAGFGMRIPFGAGGLDSPNKSCQMQSGGFKFRWHNKKLVPIWDYQTGKRNDEGSQVEYFVRFTPTEENLVEKFDYPTWMLEGSFSIPGHDSIYLLPFADFGDPKYIPLDRSDRKLWRPRLLLKEARDLAGNSATFVCNAGFSYKEINGALHVFINRPNKNATKCMTNLAFTSGAGGRLDIYEENFLEDGAAITSAVIQELNGYIVKQ